MQHEPIGRSASFIHRSDNPLPFQFFPPNSKSEQIIFLCAYCCILCIKCIQYMHYVRNNLVLQAKFWHSKRSNIPVLSNKIWWCTQLEENGIFWVVYIYMYQKRTTQTEVVGKRRYATGSTKQLTREENHAPQCHHILYNIIYAYRYTHVHTTFVNKHIFCQRAILVIRH